MLVHEEDVPKTTFTMHWGSYEFLVMPFNFTNSPLQPLHLVQDTLCEYLDDFIIIFIDNILIVFQTTEEHVEHLKNLVNSLKEHKFPTKASKCQIHVQELEFFGKWVTT